jgi:hypothetical protein
MTTARTMVGLGHYVSYKLTNDAREQAEKLKQQVAPVTKRLRPPGAAANSRSPLEAVPLTV